VSPGDHVESEVKLRVGDVAAARAALARVGATLVRERHFEENVMLDDAHAGLRASGCALRVRRVGDAGILTYKGPRDPASEVKTRREVEVAVDDPAAARSIFEALGYRPIFRYQKYRETWARGAVEIVVDETPIGCFLEIEGAIADIHATAAALGYGREAYVTESYGSLFLASGGTGDMVFA
jgi:adenylate cyclase, class 2